MDTSPLRRHLGIACLIACLIAVAGCGTASLRPVPSVKVKSSTELAVESIPDEYLEECRGMPPVPENSVGALLEDGKEAMLLLAECMLRNSKLVQYLRRVVQEERAK